MSWDDVVETIEFSVSIDELQMVADHWRLFSDQDARVGLGGAVLTTVDGSRRWVSGNALEFSILHGDGGGPSEPILVPGRLLSFTVQTDLDVRFTIESGDAGPVITAFTDRGSMSCDVVTPPDRRGLDVLTHERNVIATATLPAELLAFAVGNAGDPGFPLGDDDKRAFLDLSIRDDRLVVSIDRYELGADEFVLDAETEGSGQAFVRPDSLFRALKSFGGPVCVEIGPDPSDGVDVRLGPHVVRTWPLPLPGDQIREYVEGRIRSTFGELALARDSDGDYVIRRHGFGIYARLFDVDHPMLQVFAIVIDQVDPTSELLKEINDLNAGLTMARIIHVGQQVLAEVDLVAHTLDDDELRTATVRIAKVAEEIAPVLSIVHGGKRVDPQAARMAVYRDAVVDVEFPPGRWTHLIGPEAVDVWGFPDEVYVITASDPSGVPLPRDENVRRNQMLASDVLQSSGGYARAVGSSPDGEHQEMSCLVWGIDRDDAVGLGREYGQDAIFAVTADTVHLLPCIGDAADSWPRLEVRSAK